MKALNDNQLVAFFKSLESQYDVRVPVELHDSTRSLGRMSEGPLALAGGFIPKRITSVFFEHTELVLSANGDAMKHPAPAEKPLFVVGFTAQDAECLAFNDKFFDENFRDDLYFNKRNGAIIVVVSGKCGKDGEFLKIAGKNCDLELIFDGHKYLVAAYTEAGKKLAAKIAGDETPESALKALKSESDKLSSADSELIEKASKLILDEKVPDAFWQTVSDRCISCTSCNLACPTCTCFDVFDRKNGKSVDRVRMWDSCQLDGFMREASGHNPLGTEALRTRRRIHHKLAADVTRRGHKSCFLCGRCDEVCPVGIGIKSVCREIVEQCG